jgi:hypothetical protein
LSPVRDGAAVEDEVVSVDVAEVMAASEDSVDEVEMEDGVGDSLDNDELNVVLVIISLVEEMENEVELEDDALLETKLLEELEELKLEELAVELDETASHRPKPGWQPVPQYALELPQYEYCEQQSPYFPPKHVIPAGEAPYKFPQRAFVVTFPFIPVEDAAAEEAVRVEVLEDVDIRAGVATLLQVPNGDWQPVPQ